VVAEILIINDKLFLFPEREKEDIMSDLTMWTQGQKTDGEYVARQLSGLAGIFYNGTPDLRLYQDEDGIFYAMDGSSYRSHACGPYTLDEIQTQFEGMYLSGLETRFYIRSNTGNDALVYIGPDCDYNGNSYPALMTTAVYDDDVSDFTDDGDMDAYTLNGATVADLNALFDGADYYNEYSF
jgi:hypothetical protein